MKLKVNAIESRQQEPLGKQIENSKGQLKWAALVRLIAQRQPLQQHQDHQPMVTPIWNPIQPHCHLSFHQQVQTYIVGNTESVILRQMELEPPAQSLDHI